MFYEDGKLLEPAALAVKSKTLAYSYDMIRLKGIALEATVLLLHLALEAKLTRSHALHRDVRGRET